MSSSPRVSIVMATYNRAHMLGRGIEALQRQTFTDWELIITDDCSSDNTPAVVREWAAREPRIVSLRNAKNLGASKNYNVGFRKARGEYIAMLDDDDVWCIDDKLERQVAFLDAHPDVVGVGGGAIVINSEGKELYRFLKPTDDVDIREKMLIANPMSNSTTLFRRAIGEQVGWYDEGLAYSGDRDFWMKMGLAGKLANLPLQLGYYTIGTHNGSITHLKPHLACSLRLTKRYRRDYPNYPRALAVSYAQYWYAFLPRSVREVMHTSVVRLKRATM